MLSFGFWVKRKSVGRIEDECENRGRSQLVNL